ncbi:hypothetical protein BGZ79_009311 [Entomortierella chlamydospora]|nr:hypothetical protein BGZ79_009311 [Entomortierella chlamydospora]
MTQIKLFCIIDGASSAFEVELDTKDSIAALKKAIKKEKEPEFDDIASDKLILFQIAVPDEGTHVYLEDIDSPTPLTKGTTEISEVFGDAPAKNTIHVIVQDPSAAPSTLSATTMTGPSAASVDWKDPSKILRWLEQYRRPAGVSQSALVSSFGADFPLCSREDTFDILWNGTPLRNGVLRRLECRGHSDRNQHPIPLLASGPGTGKSRFLQEFPNMLQKKAESDENEDVRKTFHDVIAINVTFGNGTPACDSDMKLGGDACVAVRLLYEHFISTSFKDPNVAPKILLPNIRNIHGVGDLNLTVALDVVCQDIARSSKAHPPSAIVIGIDEINQLHKVCPETLRQAVHAVGSLGCSSGRNGPFYVPILAGTIQGPVESIVRESTYTTLLPPLPLLSEEDIIEIGRSIQIRTRDDRVLHFTQAFLRDDNLFRRCISDIGGMARAIESFYSLFLALLTSNTNLPDDEKELTKYLQNVDVVLVMRDLEASLRSTYPFREYVDLVAPALARAILDIPVDPDMSVQETSGSITYKELKTTGIINLEQGEEPHLY